MAKKKVVVKNPRVERTREMGTLTESAFFGKIRSALRNTFRYWKPMYAKLKEAKVGSKYKCAMCGGLFVRKEVEIDHIVGAGSLRSYEDIAGFVKRLTEEDINAYQVLCKKECHILKTKKDRNSKK